MDILNFIHLLGFSCGKYSWLVYISIYFVRSNSLQRSSRDFIFNYDHS